MSEPQTTDEENESPRTVRITFIILAFAAGCLLLPPRQWVSAGMMGGVTLLLAFIWRADLKSWWEEGKDDPKAKALKAAPSDGLSPKTTITTDASPTLTANPSPTLTADPSPTLTPGPSPTLTPGPSRVNGRGEEEVQRDGDTETEKVTESEREPEPSP